MLPTDEDASWDIDPAEAFSMLGHETRMDVLWALWEAGEPMGYAALRRQVAPDDQGNFGYHLGKLTDHFIEKSADGYELRLAGEQVVRAVIAGTITANPSIAAQPADSQCAFCGAAVEVAYDDETITVHCTECAGLVGDPLPRGTFMHYEFPPGGLEGRTPAEVVDAAHVFYDARIIPMIHGICPICAGQIATDVEVCEDHELEGDDLCETCNTRNEAWSILTCERCRYTRRSVLWFAILTHPAVISFYHDHGLDEPLPLRKLTWEHARIERTVTVDILERDPYRFRIAIGIDEDVLVVTVTGDLQVGSVERNPDLDRTAAT